MTHRDAHPGPPPDLAATLAALVDAGPTVRELVDAYIAAVVAECGGDRRMAARRLGVGLATVYRRAGGGRDASAKYSQNENLKQALLTCD